MSPLLRLIRDERGQTGVETALLLPILLLVLLGTMEFGRMAWTQLALNYAVQEAARCAAVRTDICGTPAATQAYAATKVTSLAMTNPTFTVTAQPCGWQVRAEATRGFLLYRFAPTPPKITAQVCRI